MELWIQTSILFQTTVNCFVHLLVARQLLSLTSSLPATSAGSGVSQDVTITTHKGLYRYNRLPFAKTSASAIFHKTLDTVLQEYSSSYVDILVAGADDEDHLQNLAEILKRLQLHGIRINRSKCHFMKTSVVYLGHQIDLEGLYATVDKMAAMVRATT